ncbi:MAG: SCO1664 family protein [Actinomycetota bacterium]|nr:SCO1664 family protein [Actinomycetota bacterium]MDA8342987.1 SCO1664 family protein [Actinomycetota bacterium]
MPEDKRSPAADRLIGWGPGHPVGEDEVVGCLASGELVIEGRLPWSSNLTFLVEVVLHEPAAGEGGDVPLFAVYKPARGERPLWDFPPNLYRREVAAYALSEALGWRLVPPTVERADGPLGPGSLQLFVEADYSQHYFTLLEDPATHGQLKRMCAFDIAANNADRKGGHVLAGPGQHLWGVDHGVCFHDEPKLRTVIWDFAGEPVPETLLADLCELATSIPAVLARYLTGPECSALVQRIVELADDGRFPAPTGERPYPWPLV